MPNGYPSKQALESARAKLKQLGLSTKDWALQNEFSPTLIYAVLNGQKKCLRGKSHRAAVLLGIKEGVVTGKPQQYGRRKTDFASVIPK